MFSNLNFFSCSCNATNINFLSKVLAVGSSLVYVQHLSSTIISFLILPQTAPTFFQHLLQRFVNPVVLHHLKYPEVCIIHHIPFHTKFCRLSIVKSQHSIYNGLSFPSFIHRNFKVSSWTNTLGTYPTLL